MNEYTATSLAEKTRREMMHGLPGDARRVAEALITASSSSWMISRELRAALQMAAPVLVAMAERIERLESSIDRS